MKAVRAIIEELKDQGARYPDFILSGVRIDCIPLSEWKGEGVKA